MIEQKNDIIGYVGLGISAASAIATIATSNIIPVSIGSTIGIGCNLLSRKQINNTLVSAYNIQEEKLDTLIQKFESHQKETGENLMTNKTELANQIEDVKLKLQEQVTNNENKFTEEIAHLQGQHQQLNEIVTNLHQVESLSQELRVQPDSAEFFYQRGVSHDKLNNHTGAIKDYTEAIKLDSSMAKAYHKRGVIYLQTDDKQKAIDDLRKAALLYFEQGDIESYHQAREMSQNIHELHPDGNGHLKEMVVGSKLFEENN